MLLLSIPWFDSMKKKYLLRSHERLFKCGGTPVISEIAIERIVKYNFRPRNSTFAIGRFSSALFQAKYSGNSGNG
jgi:hypothetical protein